MKFVLSFFPEHTVLHFQFSYGQLEGEQKKEDKRFALFKKVGVCFIKINDNFRKLSPKKGILKIGP